MNYKDLYRKAIGLVSSPAKTWKEIRASEEGRQVLPDFVYPMIGLCGLSEFIGTFIGKDFTAEVIQLALTRCCAVAVALFGGFFLAAYLIGKVGSRWFGCRASRETIQLFVGYSMVVTFLLNIISGLFSVLILHWILQVYTLYVAFEGVRALLGVEERRQTGYAVMATVFLLFCPFVIEYLFNELSVILN